MSSKAEAFEHWIRTSFVQMNTELENLYFAKGDRAQVIGCGDPIKASLRDEGHTYVVALLAEGNTGEGFDSAYGVLGSVGLYLGCGGTSSPIRRGKSGRLSPKLHRLRCTLVHLSAWRRDFRPRI